MIVTKLSLLLLSKIVFANFLKKFNMAAMGAANGHTFAHLLDQYHHLNIILHVDNVSRVTIGEYLSKRHSHIMIYHHDSKNFDNLKRPIERNSLNVIMLRQPIDFSKYLKKSDNIKFGDILMFMTRETTLKLFQQQYLKIPNLRKGGRVVVVCFQKTIDVYTMCFYCGKSSGILIFNQNITYGQELVKSSKLFADDFRSLHQHVLKVAYIDYFPYIYCLKSQMISNRSFCLDATGTEYQLLQSTSLKLNFSFQLIEIPNESYETLIEELIKGQFDLAIGGLSVTSNRLQKLQFGDVVRFEDIVYSFPILFHSKTFFNIFLEKDLKFLFILIILTVTVIICLIFKLSNKSTISFSNIFLTIFKIGCEQPVQFSRLISKNFTTPVYILLGSYCIFYMIIFNLMRSKMTASTISRPIESVTFKDLMLKNYRLTVEKTFTPEYLSIFTYKEQELILRNKILQKNSLCDLMKYTADHKAIVVGEQSRNTFHAFVTCKKTLKNLDFINKLQMENLRVTAHAWPFKMEAPFVSTFNEHSRNIMESGLLTIWRERILFEKKLYTFTQKLKDNAKSFISFQTFFAQFISYLLFLIYPVLCFCVELVVFWWNEKWSGLVCSAIRRWFPAKNKRICNTIKKQ